MTDPRPAPSLLARQWLWLNRAARTTYRWTLLRFPGVAVRLRDLLLPWLLRGNRSLLQREYVMTPRDDKDASGPVFQHAFQRARPVAEYRPLVSVLVPNYNHAPYLRQRLDSIFGQTYDRIEVILMDDCSTDDSRAILAEYARAHPDRARLVFNDTNSGGVFRQWEKGIAEAQGDLVWIAESDDWASPNFLETLVPFFANDAVQLAYAPTVFMNGDGSQQIWSMDNYLADLGAERWHGAFVEPAPRIVREAFALKNIIPNVSSALFRRVERLDVLGIETWGRMRTCGDWAFYLNVLRGGLLAYSPDAQNYYRIHDRNTSVTSYGHESFYREHEAIAAMAARLYDIAPETLDKQRDNLVAHWIRHAGPLDEAALAACYDPDRIRDTAAQGRKPNLMMVGYAFCAGGGETFPIQLANLMKTAGYNVTFLDCDQEPAVPGIRAKLARDIPVVSNFEDLNGIIDAFEIDIVHSHHAWVDNTIKDLLRPGSRAKTVVSLHGMYETIPEARQKYILERLVAQTDGLIYTAEKNLAALRAHGLLDKVTVTRIDNALDIAPVTPLDRASLGIAPDAFMLTLVSRALEDKGWPEAIEAVAHARAQSGRDIQLVLIGEGPVFTRLMNAGDLPPFVHLEGFRANIRAYFAASDMGFLPSRYPGESFPLVLIDCLIAGRPVLASDVGEIAYMLSTPQGPAGEVFALHDWQIDTRDLGTRIAALARDPALVETLKARVVTAMARFDPLVMRDRYDRAYAEVMAKQGGTGHVG